MVSLVVMNLMGGPLMLLWRWKRRPQDLIPDREQLEDQAESERIAEIDACLLERPNTLGQKVRG